MRYTTLPALLGLGLLLLTPASSAADTEVIVCNRGAGTFSVIDAETDTVTGTYALPAGAEPMYAVYVKRTDQIVIGDRANNAVHVIDTDDYSTVVASVPAGNGVFHMWVDPFARQLWVNNDIDNTTTVIDPRTLTVIGTADTPADLVAAGGKPHDVIVDWAAEYAYVSVLGTPGDDWVVQYDTDTLAEVGRVQVNGDDPHLSYNFWRREIYVPTQGANEVATFDARTLAAGPTIPVANAHGADMYATGVQYFLTTNIAGGGVDGLQLIDPRRRTVVDTVDTPFPTPHNVVAVQARGQRKVYVTHSGATAQEVSVYRLRQGRLELVTSLTTGFNPFGLTHVPAWP